MQDLAPCLMLLPTTPAAPRGPHPCFATLPAPDISSAEYVRRPSRWVVLAPPPPLPPPHPFPHPDHGQPWPCVCPHVRFTRVLVPSLQVVKEHTGKVDTCETHVSRLVLAPSLQVVKEYTGKVDTLLTERKDDRKEKEEQQSAVRRQEQVQNQYASLMPLALPAPPRTQAARSRGGRATTWGASRGRLPTGAVRRASRATTSR
ncbi:MAG: hypothetical protein WDW38_002566 [Sanguina aurantia]